MIRCYIAGPMSGKLHFNYETFATAAFGLRQLGLEVISPAELHEDTHRTRAHYMSTDVAALLTAQMVATLPGWEDSRGARLEVDLAEQTGKPVMHISGGTLEAWAEALPEALATSVKPERCTCFACERQRAA